MGRPLHTAATAGHARCASRPQRGMVLIEALVAILIFSVGVIGITALQSSSIKLSSAAEYRSVAALQANDLIGRMWVSDRTPATFSANFQSTSPAGAGYSAWLAAVQKALPGVAANPPTVIISSAIAGGGSSPVASSQAVITVKWQAPGDTVHSYIVIAQVK